MKTVTIPAQAKTVNALLQQARRGTVILRAADGHEFVLAEIDDFDREIELTRQNKQLMRLLDKRAAQTKTVGLAEVKARLGLT